MGDSMKDKKLVNEFLKKRSEAAFLQLYRARTPALYQTARRLTGFDEANAEDLVQEMWIIAIRKIDLFRWESELKTWLTAILINLARERRKKEERETALINDLPAESVNSNEMPLFSAAELEQAIAQLPAGYRQVIVLHDIEGYKHDEIGAILDVSVGTSKSQLHHARRALREILKTIKV